MMRSTEFRGCQLSYSIDGEGPPVILIQGVGVCGSGWAPQVDGLRSRFQCLTFDNRGIGESQPAGVSITVAQMAHDAFHLMDDAGWASAHVVGHSLGGPVSLEMAIKQPDRVRSLSLICTVARGSDAVRLTGQMLWLGLQSRIGSKRSRRRAFLKIVMPPEMLGTIDTDALAAQLAPLFGHDLAVQPPVATKQLGALRAYDASSRLGSLAGIPTVVLSAAHDPIAPPRFGKALAAGIPGARFVEFPDASHGLPLQQPERVNVLLIEHLAESQSREAERRFRP